MPGSGLSPHGAGLWLAVVVGGGEWGEWGRSRIIHLDTRLDWSGLWTHSPRPKPTLGQNGAEERVPAKKPCAAVPTGERVPCENTSERFGFLQKSWHRTLDNSPRAKNNTHEYDRRHREEKSKAPSTTPVRPSGSGPISHQACARRPRLSPEGYQGFIIGPSNCLIITIVHHPPPEQSAKCAALVVA